MHAFGFDIRLAPPERLISVESYRRAARRVLPKMVWSYVDGGADDQVTLAANRSAFDRWALRMRVLTGHDRHDLTTTVAGVPLALPVLLGPTGFAGLSHWRGDVAAARAAGSRGTRYVTSTLSSWSIEEIAAATAQPQFFQLYASRGDVAAALMRRAWDAGNRALFVTVDVPVKGNREGERRTGMGIPPTLTPGGALDMAWHLPWAYRMLRHRRVAGRNLVEHGGVAAAVESIDIQTRELTQATLNWEDLAWMRERWKGSLYVKGVLDPDDAKRAVALGADGVVVSNHGGRQVDHVPASLEALPAVVDAVGDDAEVLLDGGIRRGTDVITANFVLSIASFGTALYFGRLSDRVGAHKVFLFGSLFFVVFAFPFFLLLQTTNAVAITVALTLNYAIGWGATAAAQGRFLPSLFATEHRFSGVAVTREINSAVLAGPAPLVAVALVGVLNGQPWLVAVMIMIGGLLSAAGVLLGWRNSVAEAASTGG